ncbi:hypothetical protein CXB51_017420 [Gossypium anomalum]|uniref:Reverse transcriptase zinc-binding domain-containing protein n=1 Tax=Gossypium anomalum TaxID=47600 RepID=A0A8J6CYK6_9ROSI|nr:hypothetical protein CXB51_017420 [Gossypium anomalum]
MRKGYDISTRKRLILKEARNAWEAGKKLGFNVKGDKREVVDEIMRLEELHLPSFLFKLSLLPSKNGKSVLFCGDIWCGCFPLNEEFPRLFRVAKAFIGSKGSILSSLKSLVGSMVLDLEVEDHLIRIHDRVSQFTTKKLFSLLINKGIRVNDFLFDRMWKPKVPPRVQNFLWIMAIERISTKDFLIRWDVWLDLTKYDCPWVPKKLLADIYFSVKLDSVVGTSLSSITNKIVFHWEPPPPGWMKFNVAGVVMEDEVGCGGVLRYDIRVACALFFCAIEAMGSEMAEFFRVQFVVTHWQGIGIAGALAKPIIRRPLFSKDW